MVGRQSIKVSRGGFVVFTSKGGTDLLFRDEGILSRGDGANFVYNMIIDAIIEARTIRPKNGLLKGILLSEIEKLVVLKLEVIELAGWHNVEVVLW